MSMPLLQTKLYVPPPRPQLVPRPRLIEQLRDGFNRKLTLISAPAGFGKTTLLSEWVAEYQWPVVWLSLDKGDNDPIRLLTYVVAALQRMPLADSMVNLGNGLLALIQSPQPPSIEVIPTAMLNEVSAIPDNFILVLDDYHTVNASPIDNALTFLIEHSPPQMQVVIATREDPDLPLARYRVRNQLTELRVADLRFTIGEASRFLSEAMGLTLSIEEITALEKCTI